MGNQSTGHASMPTTEAHQTSDAASPQPAKQAGEPSGQRSSTADAMQRDFTEVPKEMDRQFEEFDEDNALRPTVIGLGKVWTKKAQKALIAPRTTSELGSEAQKTEKDAAFDLLDALTRSGAIPVECASLHVVVAATHSFEQTLLETVVQQGVNPIQKVEQSALMMASVVHEMPVSALVHDSQQARLRESSPHLLNDR